MSGTARPTRSPSSNSSASTSNNTWGLCFNEAGELFGSTANGCPIVHMPIPNRYYEKVRGLTPTRAAKHRAGLPLRADHRQGAAGGLARRLHGGVEHRGLHRPHLSARVLEPRRVHLRADRPPDRGHDAAARTARTTSARYGWNLVASDDEWCAPIDAQVGPDGHMWVIDWYAFIVQHNPTPAGFRTGQGRGLRDRSPRQDARPHLPRRLHEGQAREAASRSRTPRPRSWSRR